MAWVVQRVTELVGCDVPDAGGRRGGVDGVVDPPPGNGTAPVGEHQGAVVWLWRVSAKPLLEKLIDPGMQRNVAVGVQFPDRGA